MREESAFEDLARTLFKKEMGMAHSLYQRVNHKGNETDVVVKDDMVAGFQAKYFAKRINVDLIVGSMKRAKESNPHQTHYYIYSNKMFGNPKPPKGANETDLLPSRTLSEEKIERVAEELGLILVWKLGNTILDEVNESPWIYDVFFNVRGKLETLIREEKNHTEVAFANVGYSCRFKGNEIHIEREGALSVLWSLPSSSLCVIHGDGGCGKSAILHEFYDKYGCSAPVCFRKASSLNVRSLAEVFHQGDLYTFTEFKDAYKDVDRKYFIIDSAEQLDSIEDGTIFPSILKGLIDDDWCVVFTVRNVYVSDLLNLISTQVPKSRIVNLGLTDLSETELKQIARSYGMKLPKDRLLLDRIRNLFYLNLYTQYYDDMDRSHTERQFLEMVWNKKIRGRTGRLGYVRENEFEAFVIDRMNSGRFFLSPQKYTSEGFYDLIQDEIIADDPVNGLFITHDIFEEWGMYRLICRYWEERESVSEFLSRLGETRSARRAFRLWLKDIVTENPDLVEDITQAAFGGELTGIWKNEILCSILLSDKASDFFSRYENQLIDNECGLAEKVIWSLRVGCQYVWNVIEYKDYYLPQYAPIGTGWEYVIDAIYRNRKRLQLEMWIPVLLDWTKSRPKGSATRKAGLMVLDYCRSMAYSRAYWVDDMRKQVNCIIANSALEIKKELSDFLYECIKDKELDEELPVFILTENAMAMNIHSVLPSVVADLCLHFWIATNEDDDNSRYRDRNPFGIDEYGADIQYFPPGAFQTPTYDLLLTNEEIAISFIIRLMNGCVESYSSSAYGNTLSRVKVCDDDRSNWQWHSDTLWCMYRGIGAPLAPECLQSVHMALEYYLLEMSRKGDYVRCENLMKRLLFECHSSSVSAVVSSITLAYPDQYWKIALILFRTIEFIQIDSHRALSESQVRQLYEVGGFLKKNVYEERVESCNQEHRQLHLETACLNYQFKGVSNLSEEQNVDFIESIYDILDGHYGMVDKAEGEERLLLEILVSRMDRRKLKACNTVEIEDGLAIQLEPDLTDNARDIIEESSSRTMEMARNLDLLQWAMGSFKGMPSSSVKYDGKPETVIHDVKALKAGLNNYLADFGTLVWVCASLIRLYSDSLSESDLRWCREIIDAKLDEFYGIAGNYDGMSACMSILPLLRKLFPQNKEKYEDIMLVGLHSPDRSGMSSSEVVIEAVRYYKLWEQDREWISSIVLRYAQSIAENTLNPHDLKVLFGLMPDKPDETITQLALSCLRQIPILLDRSRNDRHAMFNVLNNLARMFMRIENDAVLDGVIYTKAILKEDHLGDSFLNHFIMAADEYNRPDRFWAIWNSFSDMVCHWVRNRQVGLLKTYLLDIPWKEEAETWHTLRRQDLDFFDSMAEICAGNAEALESMTRVLTTIGRKFRTEGMSWIAKSLMQAPDMDLTGSNALLYLELVMLPFVSINKMMLRKSPELLSKVRIILDFMISKSSVTGYMLREMV